MTTTHPAGPDPYIDTRSLWSSVDRLTRDTKQRVERSLEDRRVIGVEYVEVPCLWSQMREALASDDTGGGGGRSSAGSRAPIDVGMASLMDDIAKQVSRALVHSGIQPRREDDDGYGRRTLDTPANLRALAAHLATGTTPQHVVHEWADVYYRWVAQAETALALEVHEHATVRLPVRDTTCPHCGIGVVVRQEDDGTYRDPALLATFRDGQLVDVVCRACGQHR
ncbi:DUF7341 domain-containing protein [Klenkia brasiliensis]|uniref:DUF7341 domain-containing protein n=1 Tax=Klenkia brasiliensis TaxID=333142 RepID=A0A1G7YIK4_9ACTN|nr:hypothetical protein [Klenkia brasiliensis]SDG95690.1 hypothetical protein SAMN05660324_3953 [Klenkia brasiliensis]